MDNKEFGTKIRILREEKNLTREEFCGDETELSIRQLARIEAGASAPNLTKVCYIAERLGVKVSVLTDGENLELSRRYQELKYKILMIPTYGEEKSLIEREAYFDEIFEKYYDKLPEDEQLIIDCLQAKFETFLSDDINFGTGLLEDYLDQIKLKKSYTINDLILIDLYLSCALVSGFSEDVYDETWQPRMVSLLVQHVNKLREEELGVLNHILVNCIDAFFKLQRFGLIEEVLSACHQIMERTQDFRKTSVLCLLEWKYSLTYIKDFRRAKSCYEKAMMYAAITNNPYLQNKLKEEWEKDTIILK